MTYRTMESAPRDGTIVEIMNDYGYRPTYALGQWDGNAWRKYPDSSSSWISESYLTWKPYHGDPASYVDPTGGLQHTYRYWGVDRDGQLGDPEPPTVWQRFMGWLKSV